MYIRINFIDMYTPNKNVQKLGSVIIKYDVSDEYIVHISCHNIDFALMKQIIDIMVDGVDCYSLSVDGEIVDSIFASDDDFSHYTIMSKSVLLYQSINYIFFVEDDGWDNMSEMIRLNSVG